ncbi:tautomerase family protein [Zwartia panacis]|jgi:4-oxalocrotonate tautomerase|uniref:tautomerase family protein n=1 Tax=Zwartia panacis TaxID=2683345 RepID=UPI0025B5F69C|nr:tautomerase family protein [Zwartia panacis]MDN4017554.1 tautomerase family protein [Zwartia panacis]
MPMLNVQILQGHSAAKKTELLKKLTQSVVDSIGAPLASVRVVLQEIPAEHVIVAGEIGKEMVMITVGLIRGRTEDQKAAVIAAIFEATEQAIGVSKQNIRVILFDRPATDFGVAGGITAKAAGR